MAISDENELKIRELKAQRRRLAIAVRTVIDSVHHQNFSQKRRAEVEHEEEILLIAYQHLMKPSLPTPSDKRHERFQADIDRVELLPWSGRP